MNLLQGFLIWGIVVVVLGVLLFLFWKLFLCTRGGYENRKNEMGWGILSIFVVVATLLFLPIFTMQTDPIMVEVVDALREDTLERANDNLKENEEEEINGILSDMCNFKLLEASETIEELKHQVVSTVVKFTKNKPFVDKLDTLVTLFTIDDVPLLNVEDFDLNTIAYNTVKPYVKQAEKDEVSITSLKPLFWDVLRTTPIGDIAGVESDNMLVKAEKAVKRLLSKFFIIFNSIIAFVITALILVIVLLLKEPKQDLEDDTKRDHLFEYDRVNPQSGKTYSEELNQYN